MLETLKQTITINFSITLNSWIYFLKRGRITKYIFSKVGYEHSALTELLVIFGTLYVMVGQLFKSLMLALLGFGIPYYITSQNATHLNKESLYWQTFILFYLLMSLLKNQILQPDKRKYICVKLMRMNARKYIMADYYPQLIWRQLVELLIFAFLAKLFSVNILLVWFLLLGKNLISILGEVLNIKFFQKTHQFLHNKTAFILISYSVIIFLGYISSITGLILPIQTPFMVVLGICLCLLGIYSIRFIHHYDNFSVALNESNQMDKINIDIQKVKNDAQFARVKLKDKEFTQQELHFNQSNKKEGFVFINDIFFKRHKRILNKPIKFQLMIIVTLFVISLIVSQLIDNFHSVYISGIKSIFPIFIFALYIMSTGQKATKAMFYNCDISLLHFGFYKTKEAVLATFAIRAKHLIISNILPAGLFSLELIVLDFITGGDGITLLPVGIMITVLSIFFVIHNLFLYYIFQPYTTDLNVKNPFYKFFNFITYIICYISLQLRDVSTVFLVVVVAATLVYSITALIIVYCFAPRTFVIK